MKGLRRWRQGLSGVEQLRWRVLGLLTIVALAVSLTGAAQDSDWNGLMLNLGTELGGAVVTYLLIDQLLGRTEEQQALKERLIQEMGSTVREVAIRAVEELRSHGWVTDGSLKGAQLWHANLSGANLRFANLERALLEFSNLAGAHLRFANLARAGFGDANLAGADLRNANLEGAFIWIGRPGKIDLKIACFSEQTTLPDGSKYDPDKGLEQIERFTNPHHSNFWRSDHPASPAYRGDDDDSNDVEP